MATAATTTKKAFANIPFTNIDDEEFIGQWGGEDYPVAPKETVQVLPFLAKHFAKHLTNKILLRKANKFLEDNAGKDSKVLAKEPSWMDEKSREPLMCQMLGWTPAKLKEELDADEKGTVPKKEEPTVKVSEVQSIVDKAVKQALENLLGPDATVPVPNAPVPSAPSASKEAEFPDLHK